MRRSSKFSIPDHSYPYHEIVWPRACLIPSRERISRGGGNAALRSAMRWRRVTQPRFAASLRLANSARLRAQPLRALAARRALVRRANAGLRELVTFRVVRVVIARVRRDYDSDLRVVTANF